MIMATKNEPTTDSLQELLVSSLATTDALAALLIGKGIITPQELMQRIAAERETYQKLLHPTPPH